MNQGSCRFSPDPSPRRGWGLGTRLRTLDLSMQCCLNHSRTCRGRGSGLGLAAPTTSPIRKMAVATGCQSNWDTIVHSEHIKKWLEQSKSLRILVTGKTGVGKSALVNGIVGKYVAKEGDTLDPETSKVMEYRTKIRDVEVVIYDSPGLQDGTLREDEYLKDVEEKSKNVDLILYCTKMTDERITKGDKDAVSKLSNAFGKDKFWKNTLFVLTFANEVRLPPKRGSDTTVQPPLEEYFERRLALWKTKLHELLRGVGIDERIADDVPVVPAGYHIEPSLPAEGCEFWLSNLWFKCLDRTANAAKPALLKINWNRFATSQEVKKRDLSRQQAYDQPIVYTGNVNVPPIVLEFLGLPSQLSEAGRTAGRLGSSLGFWVGGGIGMEIGGMAGAILGELIYQYGIQILEEIECNTK